MEEEEEEEEEEEDEEGGCERCLRVMNFKFPKTMVNWTS